MNERIITTSGVQMHCKFIVNNPACREIMEGFELQYECTGPKSIPIRAYRSKKTGLKVVTANVGSISSGLVNGYFVLATESDCDDGCPHTLEHLVFMGADTFPYKVKYRRIIYLW